MRWACWVEGKCLVYFQSGLVKGSLAQWCGQNLNVGCMWPAQGKYHRPCWTSKTPVPRSFQKLKEHSMNRDGQIKHQTLPFFSTDVNGRPWWRITIHQQRRRGEVLDTKVRIRSFEYEGENQMQIAVTKGILLRLLLYAPEHPC